MCPLFNQITISLFCSFFQVCILVGVGSRATDRISLLYPERVTTHALKYQSKPNQAQGCVFIGGIDELTGISNSVQTKRGQSSYKVSLSSFFPIKNTISFLNKQAKPKTQTARLFGLFRGMSVLRITTLNHKYYNCSLNKMVFWFFSSLTFMTVSHRMVSSHVDVVPGLKSRHFHSLFV